MITKKLLFATSNLHKVSEVQNLCGDSFIVSSLKDMGFEGEVPEDSDTFEGNAIQKAKYIYDKYQIPCFADDSGLEVFALDGRPGIYSARYSGETDKSLCDMANIHKLLEEMQFVSDRRARFITVIAYIDQLGMTHIYEGEVRGTIIDIPMGEEGFGYDPVFVPEGYDKTFAQLPLEVKNTISHRARAMNAFVKDILGK